MRDGVITLFNLHRGRWYTTVFAGVTVTEKQAAAASRHGITSDDDISVHVYVNAKKVADTLIYEPYRLVDENGNVIITDDGTGVTYMDPETSLLKQYIGPKAYEALDDPTGYFTFTPERDFIAVGNYSHDEAILEDDFEEGLYHATNDKHDGVFLITGATYFSLLPHFEIGGK